MIMGLSDIYLIWCPDRMIENWMLADVTVFKDMYDIDHVPRSEGSHGKGAIKELLSRKKLVYHSLRWC